MNQRICVMLMLFLSVPALALAHSGADKGCQTIAFIFPKTKQGIIIFTNVDDGYKVYEKLLKHYLGENGNKIFEIETK